ncbi:MAG: PIG-L family deacetylase [Actinomycetota bacterium]|nr:PIG-L family deacetylase [Actinomycetota bacterium]
MTTSHADRLTPVVESDDGRGTPSHVWAAWPRVFPELDLTGWDDVLVLAPHPDDEVLGVGGLMRRLVAQGSRVEVLAVTDGDGSHPGSPTLTRAALARLRVAESAAACAALGLDPPRRAGLPDGGVAALEARLTDLVATRLHPGSVCLATWAGDGHPDHEAVGRAASAACERTGARLVQYPVWTWHWSSPDDPAVPWDSAAVLHLDDLELGAKRCAVEHFVTQLHPLSSAPADTTVLPPFVVDRLVTGREMVML